MKYLIVFTLCIMHIFGEYATGQQTGSGYTESPSEELVPDETYSPYQSQPLGHSRPFYYNQQQETAYSHRVQPPYHQQISYDSPLRYNGFKEDSFRAAETPSSDKVGLLGSGNFGVIKGGTFYSNNEEESNYDGEYNSYFHNGHGRPSYHFGGPANPRPYQHEQFANFRDFADINTPTDRQYSQYVVVYVNKNGTKKDDQSLHNRPKNIIESLQMLDEETPKSTEEIPEKKLSLSKRKLQKLLPEKKHKLKKVTKTDNKVSRDYEPLLALS